MNVVYHRCLGLPDSLTDGKNLLQISDLLQRSMENQPEFWQRPSRIHYGAPTLPQCDCFDHSLIEDLEQTIFTHAVSGAWTLEGPRGGDATHIAAALLRRAQDDGWPVIIWQDASSRAALLSMYQTLAEYVLPGVQEYDDELLAHMVLVALSSEDCWKDQLFVFDDLQSVEDCQGLIPTHAGARVIITSVDASPEAHMVVKVGKTEHSEVQDGLVCSCGEDYSSRYVVADNFVNEGRRMHHGAHSLAAAPRLERYRDLRLRHRELLHGLIAAQNQPGGDEFIHSCAGNNILPRILDLGNLFHLPTKVRLLSPLVQQTGLLMHYHFASRVALAAAYAATGESEKAISLLRELPSHVENSMGTDAPETIVIRVSCADAYVQAKQYDQAIAIYEEALERRQRGQEETLLDPITIQIKLADTYHLAGRVDEAIVLYEKLLADLDQFPEMTSMHTMNVEALLVKLPDVYCAAGQANRAISFIRDRLEKPHAAVDESIKLSLHYQLACVYTSQGQVGEAESVFEETLQRQEGLLGAAHPSTGTTRRALADLYITLRDFDRGITLLEEAQHRLEGALGAVHPHTLSNLAALASAYVASGDIGMGMMLFELADAQYAAFFGEEHSATRSLREAFAVAAGASEAENEDGVLRLEDLL